jgi:hypothetical protein
VSVSDANDQAVFGVLKGVASATPAKRTDLPGGAEEIGTVLIPSTATATNSSGVIITTTCRFTSTAGGKVPFRTLAELQAWTTAAPRQDASVIADATTANNGEYVRSGSIWIAQAGTGSGTVTPSTGWVNPSVLPGNSLVITPLGIDRIAPGYGVLSGILAYTGADVSGAVWGDRYQVAAISGVTVRRFTEVPGISGTGSPIAINVRTDGKVYFRYITTSTGTVNTSTWVRLDGIVVPILY